MKYFYRYHAIAGRGLKFDDAEFESDDENMNDDNPEAFHCHELLYNIQELIDDTEKNIISVRIFNVSSVINIQAY